MPAEFLLLAFRMDAGETYAPCGALGEYNTLLNTNAPIWHLHQDRHDVHLNISDPVHSSNSYQTLRDAVLAGTGGGLLPFLGLSSTGSVGRPSRAGPASNRQPA